MLGLNDTEIYFFLSNLVDKAMVRFKSSQMLNEMHMLHYDCFLTFVNGSDFINEQYNTVFNRFRVLHNKNR